MHADIFALYSGTLLLLAARYLIILDEHTCLLLYIQKGCNEDISDGSCLDWAVNVQIVCSVCSLPY